MRLFIAIPVPADLHRYCRQLQSRFDGLKNVNDFHLTLQFLGDDIENPDQIIDALSQIKFGPFEIEMGDALPFGPKNEPRGVWIECKENSALNQLAGQVRQTLAPLGYESDKPFRAHITLGRYKLPPKINPKKVSGTPHYFRVDHFELIQSHLEEGGPRYKVLQKFLVNQG
ncbi:RNA 2',3'-cyclic phosphodiesterase [Patescibacteria group bacterium]|nr:RNA 2',3'-cyclic phosphodiesterase [Patescibacteria group bacterium]MBU1015810.1 RNA 2',3'-cyclic phosphodiesterase [Patescibacteria group bacterium]MBU1685229.1 RNA 2',3'-cyclic phosphodiesterase [Patescibacteria group bacterium]MBU1938238.1 RNA 2',3'-cyclic phosphodiesterase [Patescibacteria group bacterium]